MASKKVSGLTALTTAGTDDLLYISDTSDSGSSYASKKITVANLFNGYATESYVGTQIANVIDSAPGALNTLNELAAALGDDASFSTTITNMINANETHVDNVATLSGVAKDSTSLGTFTGSTISDNQTVKAAIQALETAVESAGSASSLSAVVTDASDLQTLTGIADGNSDLGTFTGSTINDSVSIKVALQALETALEAVSLTTLGVTATAAELNVLDGITATTAELNYVDGVTSNVQTQLDAKTADGDNVNVLVANTSADTAPSSYYFLVADSSTGAIKAIEKSFMEIDQLDTVSGVSFAFTPEYVFDGSNTDSSHENYSSGDDVFDTYGINKIGINNSFVTVYFTSSTTMAAWRNTDRSVQFEYTGSGSKGWEGTFDLTSDEEYSVNNSFHYVHYSTSDVVGTTTLADLLADDISSNGTGSSILNINDLG